MTTAQVVETSVTVNINSPIQDYVHPEDQTQPTIEMTPGLKPFTEKLQLFEISARSKLVSVPFISLLLHIGDEPGKIWC